MRLNVFDTESESRRRYGSSYRQSSGEGRGGIKISRSEGVKERREGGIEGENSVRKERKETLKGRRADKETKVHYSDDIDQQTAQMPLFKDSSSLYSS